MKLSGFNKVIIYLTTSDVFTWGLTLVLTSIAGLYLSTKIGGDTVQIVGIGTGVASFARALFQIPIGIFLDRFRKDKDDILVLFLGNFLMGFPYILFPLIKNEYLYYALQAILGTGAALNLVSWRKLFAKNLDKGKEGLEYASYDTVMSISIGIFGIASGIIANQGQQYFDAVMWIIGLIIISSGIWPLLLFTIPNRKK